MSRPGTDWSMMDEREFIRNLGQHSVEDLRRQDITRADMLRGYLAGLDVRRVWAGLVYSELRGFALEELMREEGKVS